MEFEFSELTFSMYAAASKWFIDLDKYLSLPHINMQETNTLIDMCNYSLQGVIEEDNIPESLRSLYQIENALINVRSNLRMMFEEEEEEEYKRDQKRSSKSGNRALENNIKSTKQKPQCGGLVDIAGYADLKRQLKSVVVLPRKQPQLFVGRKMTQTILLYGPPGTGKTQMAHALAAEINANIYCVTSSTLICPYSGETEKSIQLLFKLMREASEPTFLFIDEIDGLCRRRTGSESDHNRRIKTEIMCHFNRFHENKDTFLICATNCPWDLDSALIRRFQKRIYVPLPDRTDRKELLTRFTENSTLYSTYPFWDSLLDVTDGYSASDLKDLVECALARPITELTEVKVWNTVDGQHYFRWNCIGFTDKVLFSTIDELPDGSVQAREAVFEDLLEASKVVKRTVPQSEIERFGAYFGDSPPGVSTNSG